MAVAVCHSILLALILQLFNYLCVESIAHRLFTVSFFLGQHGRHTAVKERDMTQINCVRQLYKIWRVLLDLSACLMSYEFIIIHWELS